MTAQYETIILSWAIGQPRNLARAKNKTGTWENLKNLVRKPVVTAETRREFDKMSKEQQDILKSQSGWFSGAQCEGEWRNKKNILPRDVATIDIDYADASLPSRIDFGLIGISDFEFVAHSSRRHTLDEPRIRMIIPMSRKVSVDEYTAVIRYIGWLLDPAMKLVDPVSYRPAQMMFLPTCSKDDAAIYYFHENHGRLFDVDHALNEVVRIWGAWNDLTLLPKHPDEEGLRKRADKAENPLEKKGPIGDFCRAFSITAAIDTFLPGVYLPGDEHSGHPRYTYAGSTSSNGAVVYDNDTFLYSHHGHDPVCDMNVNAWDLVRIHLYGDQDEKTAEDVPQTKRPSYKAMLDLVTDNPEFKRQQLNSRYDTMAMFDDAGIEPEKEDLDAVVARLLADLVGDGGDSDSGRHEPDRIHSLFDGGPGGSEASPRREVRKGPNWRSLVKRAPLPAPPAEWHLTLETDRFGDILPTSTNISMILSHDPRVRSSIEYNVFRERIVARTPLQTRMSIIPTWPVTDIVNGDAWDDFMLAAVRVMIEAENGPGKPGWGVRVADRDLKAALQITSKMHRFHPVQDALTSFEWDGVPRVETVFIDYLGADDNVYVREACRKWFIAAVARAFEPGHKFDFVPILEGLQGKAKSTFIETLALGWFGELKANFDDEKALVEQMSGCWVMEVPELSKMSRATVEDVKAFVSSKETQIRMAYDALPKIFKRQCVFMGTTNEVEYLIDEENRRFWPILCNISKIDLAKLRDEVSLIWAEAYQMYLAMRAAQPDNDLPLYLEDPESDEISREWQQGRRVQTDADVMAGAIQEWLDTPIMSDELGAEPAYRDKTCILQLWTKALDRFGQPTTAESRAVGRALRQLGWTHKGRGERLAGYGSVKVYHRTKPPLPTQVKPLNLETLI